MISTLVIGLIVGWLASLVLKKSDFGVWHYLAFGLIGSFLGNKFLGFLGHMKAFFIGERLVKGFIGALLVILLFDYLKKKKVF
jgi:uncharacterized membrane protein YeaQ/YmgE (transglycosylase-associated protein family)